MLHTAAALLAVAAAAGEDLASGPAAEVPRQPEVGRVLRNRDDHRRARLTKEKTQHVERVLRYADSGDGYARLEALDLYDVGATLVAELVTEHYPGLVEIELDGATHRRTHARMHLLLLHLLLLWTFLTAAAVDLTHSPDT